MKDLLALQTRIKAAWADIHWLQKREATEQDFTDLLDDTKSIVKALDQIVARRTPSQTGKETDERITAFLEGVMGAVEADSFSKHMLWLNHAEEALKYGADTDKRRRFKWEDSNGGPMTCVGTYDGRECWISLGTVKLDGHKILVYHATSSFVDHDLVRAWLDANLPDTARRSDGSGYINNTDADNFHIVWPRKETATA